MLVLSRKQDQSIRVGPDVTIHVGRIRPDRVALIIDAPPHVPIRRGELPERPAPIAAAPEPEAEPAAR